MADDEPEFAAAFNEGMISDRTRRRNRCLRPFCGMRLARGVLFDAEPVVAGAPAVLDVAGVADRTAVVGGSFFESVPLGGDAYVLKDIVHDWDESKVLEILRNVRNAVSAGAKLLVVETVIPDDDREHLSKLLDLEMLVAGTREGTYGGGVHAPAESRRLLQYAGDPHRRSGIGRGV